MLFTQHFNIVEQTLQASIINTITKNHTSINEFRLWLKYEAGEDISYKYLKYFKAQFNDYIDEPVKMQIEYAGKNFTYAILGFTSLSYTFDSLLIFVESFLTEQLDQFENDFNISWTNEDGTMKVLCENPI